MTEGSGTVLVIEHAGSARLHGPPLRWRGLEVSLALSLLALLRDGRPFAAVCLTAGDSDVDGFVRELGY